MAKSTSCKEAIANFEKAKGVVAAETDKVLLFGQVPPIDKMDASLSSLKACKQLSLSTNSIEKISSLSGMENLKVLALGRNQIKKIENLDSVAESLEELWISYNVLERLDLTWSSLQTGVEKLASLRVFLLSNNKIGAWSEVERLGGLTALEELLLVGNPLYNEYKDKGDTQGYRIEVLKRLPQLKKLDGIPVDVDERDTAKQQGGR